MHVYEMNHKDIHNYLVTVLGYKNISTIVVNCIVTQITIIQQVRNFKTHKDMFEVIDNCAFQYIDLNK